MTLYPNCTAARETLTSMFKRAHLIHTERWQGMDISNMPEAEMRELLHETVQFPVPIPASGASTLAILARDIKPNLPWADDHFEERICGQPLNPGETWKSWPWSNTADDHRDDKGQFNHNYMERYWPKYAGMTTDGKSQGEVIGINKQHRGIRYRYGDLDDLIELLKQEPFTRQAYLPIFFPEDTGIANPGRKPCTLGYHFILRHGHFHCTYYIRSCDFHRHFADDVYMTIRLQLYIMNKIKGGKGGGRFDIKPGFFIMHITSLHLFVNDLAELTG